GGRGWGLVSRSQAPRGNPSRDALRRAPLSERDVEHPSVRAHAERGHEKLAPLPHASWRFNLSVTATFSLPSAPRNARIAALASGLVRNSISICRSASA